MVPEADIARAEERFGQDVIYLPVSAEEASGRNKIPVALAALYAERTDADATADIVQSSRSYHTGAKPTERLIARPAFDGPVEPGRRYVLVNDVTVVGGTLAELAEYIPANAAWWRVSSPLQTLVGQVIFGRRGSGSI
ncbi:MAG: hypothetical protein OHK0024_33530 [Thalassobaculales bacterium]